MNLKNKLLLLVILLLGILVYTLFLRPLVNQKNAYLELKLRTDEFQNKINSVNQMDSMASSYKIYLNYYDKISDDFEALLLQKVTRLSDSLSIQLLNLKEHPLIPSDSLSKQRFEIQFQGSFNSSLQLIQELEYNLPLTIIVHVQMQTKKNARTKRKTLETNLFLEHLK